MQGLTKPANNLLLGDLRKVTKRSIKLLLWRLMEVWASASMAVPSWFPFWPQVPLQTWRDFLLMEYIKQSQPQTNAEPHSDFSALRRKRGLKDLVDQRFPFILPLPTSSLKHQHISQGTQRQDPSQIYLFLHAQSPWRTSPFPVSPHLHSWMCHTCTRTPLLENPGGTQQKTWPKGPWSAPSRTPGDWDTCHMLQPPSIERQKSTSKSLHQMQT